MAAVSLANGEAMQHGVAVPDPEATTDGVRDLKLGEWITIQCATSARVLAVYPAQGGYINVTQAEAARYTVIEIVPHGKNLRHRAGCGDSQGDGEELATMNTGTAQAQTLRVPLDAADAFESHSSDWRLRFRLR